MWTNRRYLPVSGTNLPFLTGLKKLINYLNAKSIFLLELSLGQLF